MTLWVTSEMECVAFGGMSMQTVCNRCLSAGKCLVSVYTHVRTKPPVLFDIPSSHGVSY